ncbi:hypothetical protein V8C34DRAFT_275147 [Trichoderma compactum]
MSGLAPWSCFQGPLFLSVFASCCAMIRSAGSGGTGRSLQCCIGGLGFDSMVCSWGSGGRLVPPLAEEEKGTCGTCFLFFFQFFLLVGSGEAKRAAWFTGENLLDGYYGGWR